jgi:beta-lactamase regulating signal transducer with metallopeptidase domain/polyhydroxyalkanoate synthesis regulator phasin
MPPIWLVGSVLVLAGSLVRVWRFSRLLAAESEAASPELYTAATKVARRLGLKKIPMIRTTPASLSPMVWWAGGRVQIIIPLELLDQMDAQQQELILAHELAHVRRHDHFVRWIEWLCCVCFWWNPVVWWAQRNLRASEEICCDELVVSSLNSEPKYYANTLLSIVEFLARSAIRPPAVASEINSGGALERRFKMIVSEKSKDNNTRWMQVCVLLLAVIVLPLSMAYAKDAGDKTEAYLEQVNNKLNAAVEAGKMTEEEAAAKIEAIEEELAKKAEVDAYFEKVWANLRAQVEAGTLTAEDADVMMGAVKKRFDEQAKRDKYESVVEKIKAAVDAGEITEDQARTKIAALQKKVFDKDQKDVDWSAVKERIEDAVERGDLTREEADAKYAEIKERLAHGDKDAGLKKRYDIAVKEIKAAVDAGEITEDQARERYEALRKRIAAAKEGQKKDVDWDSIKQRIEGAVERGDLTREEADAKYIEIKERLAWGERYR